MVIFNNKNREQKKWRNVTGFLQLSAVSEKSPGDTRLYASALVSLGEMGDPLDTSVIHTSCKKLHMFCHTTTWNNVPRCSHFC